MVVGPGLFEIAGSMNQVAMTTMLTPPSLLPRCPTYLGVPSPGHVLGAQRLLDAVHLLLVALAVLHGALLGGPQDPLQGLDPLRRGPQTLLQLGQLAAQICVVPDQLEHRGRVGRRCWWWWWWW